MKHFRQGLDIARDWGNLYAMGAGFRLLVSLYLKGNQRPQARQPLQEFILTHLEHGQDWQLLGAMTDNARRFPELVGGDKLAVSYLAMVYHHPDAVAGYRSDIDDALPVFEEKLGKEQFAAAWESGQRMDLDTSVAMMLAELEQ